MQLSEKKKIICLAMGKAIKKLRGKKSLFMLGAENDISTSILSTIEKGTKDPQLTTVIKLAEAFNLSFEQLARLVEKELPKDFSLIEK